MSHDNHNHHHETHNDKPTVEFKSAFYFVIILAGLFLASISFVQSMSHDEAGHGGHGAQHSEAPSHDAAAGHGAAGHEAAKHEEMKNETEAHNNAHPEAEHKEATPAAH
jgi:hypothetical protein